MAKRDFQKKPLYRKVNRRTHSLGMHERGGEEYRWTRNAKEKTKALAEIGTLTKTHYNGLDFTPLSKFLLSRVGKPWLPTYQEAVSRLPDPVRGERRDEPIFCMVYDPENDPDSDRWLRFDGKLSEITCVGEYALFSTLVVDNDGLLQKRDPDVGVQHISPYCPCHTHTFNGVVVTNSCRNSFFASHPDVREVDTGHWKGYLRR